MLSQFADDLDLIRESDQQSWNELMYELDFFEDSTGMKISYEKTTIYRIGSLHNSDAKFYSSRKVKWVSEPINVLGVFISHHENELM